jgi:transposase
VLAFKAEAGVERRLRREEVMTIEVLYERGLSKRAIARQLGVHENAVRYRLKRRASPRPDGRDKVSSVAPFAEAICEWMRSREAERGVNGLALYEWLVAEHGFGGSYKAVQRFVRAQHPRPRVRARRRVETPPGAQAQADWAEFRGVVVGDTVRDLFAFHLVLSHSRAEAIVWSEHTDELAWLSVHNAALGRLGGVPAVIRVDNCKTAIAWGAGPWGTVNERYAVYARTLRFHVDAARPRAPEDKGKVERRILAHKAGFHPRRRAWRDLAELQAATDAAVERSAQKRICPATGLSVWESAEAERRLLTPLPAALPEPFDRVVQREVSRDALVSFEGHSYSVPFRFVDQTVEVRGCAATVEVWAEGRRVAEHPRRTRQRILIDPRHYEGASTPHVAAPTPLGRMGRRLQEIWAMPPERRPIDQYAALAEVAR